jgi:hypothetical protein
MSADADKPQDGDNQDADTQVQQLLSEAHMILPGLLTLLGLQITSVFNPVYQEELGRLDHVLHLVALCLLAVGAALVVTPAAYHRQVSPHDVPDDFPAIASTFVTIAMIPLMLAIAIDVYLVSKLACEAEPVSIALSAALLLVFVGLWFVFPRIMMRRRGPRAEM